MIGKARSLFTGSSDAVAIDRLGRYLESFTQNQREPYMQVYPGLRSIAWRDPADFPVVHALESNYDNIREEIAKLGMSRFQPESEDIHRAGRWDVSFFYEKGKKNVENCLTCPVLTQIVETHETMRTMAGLIYVSKLRPGSHIARHRGPTNLRLRCHLGIAIPHGDCRLKVGREARHWRQGRCVVFDDYLPHEAWNYTTGERIVLIIDIWHPDLTSGEVAFLEGLHRFAYAQAKAVSNYWNANAATRGRIEH